jgi:PEP-CTERM motif
MRKLTLVLAGAVLLFALPSIPTYAQNQDGQGGNCQGQQNNSCTATVPEPSSFVLLATGLAALGGLAILNRKRLVRGKQ